MKTLPLEFDTEIYRSLHADLEGFSDQQLLDHYRVHGRREGRRAHELPDRDAFAALIADERALEIGLNIDWVVTPTNLDAIDEKFDAVLSSHAIEHQPDLVGHLHQVSELLHPGGRYLLLVADHRYCADHFTESSTIVDVLDAHARKITKHDPKSLILSRCLITHNEPVRHWNGDHGLADDDPDLPRREHISRLASAVKLLNSAPQAVHDDRAWFFAPDSFALIINDLRALALCDLQVERVYPTLRNTCEFWAVLTKR